MLTESPVSVPPPPFVTFTVPVPASPRSATKAKLDAPRTIDGREPETVNATVIVRGLLLATGDATETVAEYVPAVNDPVTACSVTVAGAVVALSDADSHPVPDA